MKNVPSVIGAAAPETGERPSHQTIAWWRSWPDIIRVAEEADHDHNGTTARYAHDSGRVPRH